MNAALLQTQLQLPYRRASWFSTTGLLPQLLPGRLELFAQAVEFALATEAEQAVATGFRQLGRVFLPPAAPGGPERIVALHEITVAANIDLLRNRVGLRRLVARGIDEVNAHAVLAFFVQPGETAYRLTYAARESVMNPATLAIERQETAARRFTYILGPGDARRTAALRLAGLANERTRATASLESLTAAFAVESLNNEFFTLYRAHYEAFRDYLLGTDAPTRLFGIPAADLSPGVDAKQRDRALKPVRDFVKKLLGRIVFLHFLQKKGWLGCPATSRDWTHGDPLFLDNLFRQTPTADRFHSERLVPLFYDTLNRPDRPGDVFPVTGTRVPYLNGGLFERDFPGVDRVDFPGELFARLFEFLGGYHFTIDENDPEDHEIGIDPEMLGHIFENLLEDNKDKGAYYTPKAVVHYMARQSLVHALTARFPGDVAAPAEIATFLRLKEPVDPRTTTWLSTHATDLATHLDDLRICDPAIGSGAFPIGLLHEIYWAKLALNSSLNRAAAKRAIIQNSIHGVDLDAGAVEIARLRFWLALVVDETAPSPLPNLDYQIMQGNSLLESFEGEPLDDLAEPTRYGIRRLGSDQNEFDLGSLGANFAAGAQAIDDALGMEMVEVHTAPQQRLAELRAAYFRCHDPLTKARLRGEIDAAVLQAIDARLDRRRDELETSLEQEATFVGRRARTARETRARAAMETELSSLRGKTARLHALLADPRAERPFFLWHLWFRHVLAEVPEGRGGFDIVIANPPYVRMEGFKDHKEEFAELYTCFSGRADLFVYFYEQSINLLRADGVLCFITSNKYFRAVYGEKLRTLLGTKSRIHELIDFGDTPVFDATAYPSIIVLQKLHDDAPSPVENQVRVFSWEPGPTVEVFADIFARDSFLVPQAELRAEGWAIRSPFESRLLEKMRTTGTRLDAHLNGKIYYGVKTGLNEAFVIDSATRLRLIAEHASADEIIKPFYRGRDLERWSVAPHERWLIYTRKGINIADYPSIRRHLQPFRSFTDDKGNRVGLDHRATEQEWFELQQAQYAYASAFEAPKIIYPDIYEHQSFAWDESGAYLANTCYFLPTNSKWLVALLNTKAVEWFYTSVSNAVRGGYLRAFSDYISQIPIPAATPAQQAELTAKVDAILAAKRAGDAARVAALEAEIDVIVYRLYGLTALEITLIEGRA